MSLLFTLGERAPFKLGKSLHFTLGERAPFRLGKSCLCSLNQGPHLPSEGATVSSSCRRAGCRISVETVLPRPLMPHPTLKTNSVLHLLIPLPLLRTRVA